jgi:hypothetical protein
LVTLQIVIYTHNEEKELGLRLRAAGWLLLRLKRTAVLHFGHSEPTWSLLLKRWRTRYVDGGGDWLRAAWGKPYFINALMQQKQYLIVILLWLLTVLGFVSFYVTSVPLTIALFSWLAVLLLLLMKKGLYKGVFTLAYLNFWSAGVVRGFFHGQKDPSSVIEFELIQQRCVNGE